MPIITPSGGGSGGSGTVTNVSSANGDITVASPTTTPVLTFAKKVLASVASTGNAGYALINGTGNILSYTTPNDGALHPVVVTFALNVSVAATGGILNFNIAGVQVQALSVGFVTSPPGWYTTQDVGGGDVVMSLPANTAVTITQDGALTLGAVKAYIQILSA